MKSIAGIFGSREDARRAFEHLRSEGIFEEHLNLLVPGEIEKEQLSARETRGGTEPTDVGAGKTFGSILGGASGLALGPLATAAVTALIPGIGPIAAIGVAATALFGAGGGLLGAKVGERIDEAREGEIPHDELYVYEDALRNGNSVVIALVPDQEGLDLAGRVLRDEGAGQVDVARDQWWTSIRDNERTEYSAIGGNFDSDEPKYRHGFESALHTPSRGHSYDEARQYLTKTYPNECDDPAFRAGYERGCRHYDDLRARYQGPSGEDTGV